jgi:radical SAM superfamily enzyme YgiQ (UPF0313 family)
MAIDTARARAQLRPKVIPSSLVSEPIVKDVSAPPRRRFEVILVKPSHYDDDGYVIQWFMSVVPSNSLAALYGLARDAEARRVLGDDVEINVTAIDETNTRIKPRKLIRRIARNGGFGMVGLVGVQSNQYPRALDIARPLRASGIPVVIGGFHVSGTIAMLPVLTPDLQEALDLGISLFAGEAEKRFDDLLRDAACNNLKPIYNYMRDLPNIQAAPAPFLPRPKVNRTIGRWTTFDAGRGCPFQCSFCTIINVQGRTSRHRSPDDVERIIRHNHSEGITRFFITDDNFTRNTDWEPIFDRIIEIREMAGIDVKLMIQVDTLCHKIPAFVEKAARAGVQRVFIGMESINPRALIAAKKRQNRITEYRKMLLAWKSVGVITFAGYILGFATDTPASIKNDIEIIKRELPIDILEFYCLTPLPGSEDHQLLWSKKIWMDPDLNKYDGEHAVTGHPHMSLEAWEEVYTAAWKSYYTPEHMEAILRRGGATGIGFARLKGQLLLCAQCEELEDVHPMHGGILRRKVRPDRRPGLSLEPAWSFYPKYVLESLRKLLLLGRHAYFLHTTCKRIKRDPLAKAYTDAALTPIQDDELEELELFTHTDDAKAAVDRARQIRPRLERFHIQGRQKPL